MLEWFHQGGMIMWILLIISTLSWCFIFERFYVIYFEMKKAKDVHKHLNKTGYEANNVIDCIRQQSTAFTNVMNVVCENNNLKKEDNMLLTRSQLKEETEKLQRGLTTLEIAASISPLLGLLGTVLGMVEVFGIIAKVGLGDPGILSSGISKALNTTVFGLIVAIPSLAAFSIYERKIEKLIRLIEKSATITLSKIYGANPDLS